MTNEVIYKVLERFLDKETNGGYIDPKTYNYYAPVANTNTFKRLVNELYGRANEGEAIPETLFSSKLIRPLLTESNPTAVTSGEITISSLTDYAYWGKMMTAAAYDGQVRKIDLLPHNEVENRIHNILARAPKRSPFAEINGLTIKIYPTDISSVNFLYIKYPDTPVFDYYIDTNQQIVYLAEGVTGFDLPDGTVYSDGTLGTAGVESIDSTTVELEYDQDYHVEFMIEMAKLFGARQADQLRGEFARIEQQIQDNN